MKNNFVKIIQPIKNFYKISKGTCSNKPKLNWICMKLSYNTKKKKMKTMIALSMIEHNFKGNKWKLHWIFMNGLSFVSKITKMTNPSINVLILRGKKSKDWFFFLLLKGMCFATMCRYHMFKCTKLVNNKIIARNPRPK
jgi:hypothetical protein